MLDNWKTEAPAGGERHEIVIAVGISSAELARAVKEATMAELAARFTEAEFSMVLIGDDFVDGGAYMVVGCRGKIGNGGAIKPMPPYGLMVSVDRALQEMRFLEPPTAH
jgi:hypothetical protein